MEHIGRPRVSLSSYRASASPKARFLVGLVTPAPEITGIMTSHARSTFVYLAVAWIAVAAVLTPSSVYAQPGPSLVPRSTVPGTTVSQISGVAFHADDSPIARAMLQLRNLVTGGVAGAAVANDAGQFVFLGMAPGIYIVELTSRRGKVLAVSDAVAVARTESAATFVREKGQPGSLENFFANAAVVVSSAAAATGITAIRPEAKRPVSPQK